MSSPGAAKGHRPVQPWSEDYYSRNGNQSYLEKYVHGRESEGTTSGALDGSPHRVSDSESESESEQDSE